MENISWPGWETTRLIGRGSFGAVYEIQRKVFDDTEKAALKMISIPQNACDIDEMYNDGYDDESITSTFQSHLKSIVAEYSLMKRMNGCTNIVNCDDVRYVQHDDGIGWDIFIKMELLTPLTKALSADISEETVIKLGMDMCQALVMCNKYGIIHRDIKPQNIFVSDNGDYKLGDFGIAKTVEKTMGGTKIGTYKYMAPEVYNNQPYGSSADIYSLGLVLYWMLNEKRMPFMPLPPVKLQVGMEEQARYRRFSGETIPEPKNGGDALKAVVLKACAYDPKDRFLSAAEMLDALQQVKTEGRFIPVPDPDPDDEEDDGDETVGPVDDWEKGEEDKTKKKRKGLLIGILILLFLLLLLLMKCGSGKEKPAGTTQTTELQTQSAVEKTTEEEEESVETTMEKSGEKTTEESEETTTGEEETSQPNVHIHNWSDATCTTPKICECGETEGSALGHQWKSATCTEPQICTNCGAAGENALGHQWTDATCANPQTCTRCGATGGVALGHQWKNATCTEPKICINCGVVGENALGHQWIAATYTTPKTCSRCGLTEGEAKFGIVSIAAGQSHTVVLMSDGTVRAYGSNRYGECDVSEWRDIVAIAAAGMHTVGLKRDGTVVAVGLNEYVLCNVGDWTDIVSISTGEAATVGVKSNGTVVAAIDPYYESYDEWDVSGWTNIVQVTASDSGIIGLTNNGEVLCAGFMSNLNWTGITKIDAYHFVTIGLKTDGNVLTTYEDEEMVAFTDIVDVAAGWYNVFGLKRDGRVVRASFERQINGEGVIASDFDFSAISEWTDICMIAAGAHHIVGLKSDGTLVATGNNSQGQCDVYGQ